LADVHSAGLDQEEGSAADEYDHYDGGYYGPDCAVVVLWVRVSCAWRVRWA
jgi:hypothetical protein